MRRVLFVVMALLAAFAVNAQTIIVDDFEGYQDDYDVQDNWTYSNAGGTGDVYAWLNTNDAAEGSQCLGMDVAMPEKWYHNIIRKEIPEGPLDLSQYINVQFQFAGDALLNSGELIFTVFLYDSQNRVIKFALPAAQTINPEWQKVTMSLDAFSDEEWDAGHGTDAPDVDRTDIVALGLMAVGDADEQYATFYIDNIKINAKPEDVTVGTFEDYADSDALKAVWVSDSEELAVSLNTDNNAPEGSNSIQMDFNMPLKWYHRTARHDFEVGALSLSKFTAIEMWFYGDANLAPGGTIFTVFLFDGTGRKLKFALPAEYVVASEWQKVTLSLDAFSEEEWDAGHGTATPDADKNNIVALGLMCVGDADEQVGTFYVDDIHLVSQQSAATVDGTVTLDGAPMPGVKVVVADQTSFYHAVTNDAGEYKFDDFQQGKQYRIIPIVKGYDFDPAVQVVTLFGESYTQDFAAAPSAYNSLETETVSDQFDESGLNADIVYRGAREWGDDEAGDVRPIVDVTVDNYYVVNFPDSTEEETVLYSIEPNTLSDASSPKYALEVGGFYGWDMLALGQNADANYYVEVDAYCDVRFDAPENMFDRVSLGIHCSVFNPDKPSLDAYEDGNPFGNSGGYALSFETDSGDIIARKYATGNSKAHVVNRSEGFAEDFARLTLEESGWHRFRVAYLDGVVTFTVDGETLAEVTDNDYPNGPAGLHYRAAFSDALADLVYMNHARFDNLKAGPTGSTGVSDWMLN